MKKYLAILVLGLSLSSCTQKTQCTTEDRSNWIGEETFKSTLETDGYKINEFKVTEGNCYEIYGWDQDQNKVEVYFNPVDGSVVKKEIH